MAFEAKPGQRRLIRASQPAAASSSASGSWNSHTRVKGMARWANNIVAQPSSSGVTEPQL